MTRTDLPSLDTESALVGGFVGLAFGILIGVAWQDAYCMIKAALEERAGRRKTECGAISGVGLALGLVALMQVSLGIFQIVAYTSFRSFVNCQATYNQAENEARYPRLDASEDENKKFYRWLETLPPLLAVPEGQEPDPKLVRKFRTTLVKAIAAHEERVEVEKKNPFPESPEEVCGEL